MVISYEMEMTNNVRVCLSYEAQCTLKTGPYVTSTVFSEENVCPPPL